MVDNSCGPNWPAEGIRRADGTVTVWNSILWNNGTDAVGAMTLNYSSVGTRSGAEVTLTDGLDLGTDPKFAAGEGNYRLDKGSPCINTGLNQDWMTGATDLDGNPRILEQTVDMGAYESVPPRGTLIIVR